MQLQSSTASSSLLSQLDPQSAAEAAKKSPVQTVPPIAETPSTFGTTATTLAPSTSNVAVDISAASIKSVPESVMQEELTLEGLMKHWGMSDTAYDLDASGTVDMQDLVKMLAGMDGAKQAAPAGPAGAPPPPPGAPGSGPAPAPGTGPALTDADPLKKNPSAPVISGAPDPSGPAAPPPGDRLATAGPVDPVGAAANAKKRAMIDARAAAETTANTAPTGTTGSTAAAPIDAAIAAATPEAKAQVKASGDAEASGIDPLLATTAPADPANPADLLSATDPSADVDKPASDDPGELTVDGLMEAWGTDNADYDLDGNGSVGMNDLLQMLAGMDDDGGGDGEVPASSLDGLMKAWGTDEPMYDLDGDGTVGMSDLLQYIAGDQDPPSGLSLPDDAKFAEFANAWGTADPTFDVDGDGVVGERDLAALMAGVTDLSAGSTPAGVDPTAADPAVDALLDTLAAVEPSDDKDATKADDSLAAAPASGAAVPAELSPTDPQRALRLELLGGPSSPWSHVALSSNSTIDISTVAGLSDYSVQAATLGTKEAAADVIAASVQQRLSSLGFGDTPPSNLHQIVDGLKLNDADASMVMDRLNARYPDGLGLSVVG